MSSRTDAGRTRRGRAVAVLACLSLTGALHLAAWAALHAAPPPVRTATRVPAVTVRIASVAEPDTSAASSTPAAHQLPTPSDATHVQVAMPVPDAGEAPPAAAYAVIDAADGPDYLPRPWLSVAPTPVEPVALDYPALEGDTGWHRAVLALFIDEAGVVQRVRVEEAELPAALEEAARKAFMGARFRPGELDGVAVRSRLRVEVEFDSRSR
ncbi:energy transducer TonB [Caldimonas sp. KR1-144]|uniref:energy transducer TonB n=1 Tax=Caldimonas sp. KR1-144 TaxID=3400911 RepID=UPI003C09C5E1